MANGVFNIARGRAAYYATLPAASDALIVVLLKSAGLVADDTLNDYVDLAAILAGASDEADFTNYARKAVTASVTVTIDNAANLVDADLPDQTWAAAGGATNNVLGKLLICYDADTGAGTDSAIIPLTYHDFSATTDCSDLTAQIASTGFFRATA